MKNYCQAGLFVVVLFSILLLGIKVYQWFDPRKKSFLNRYVYLGEVLLLGAIGLIGAYLILSLVCLYKFPFLCTAMLLNFLWIFDPAVRRDLKTYILKPLNLDIGTVLFFAAVGFFIFRNCFFLSDVDSLTHYLFTQKLWVQHGSSFVGTPNDTCLLFFPQFDYILDSLGISLWGGETLYPALINLFWRVIALLLVFGYTKYRLQGSLIALAAVFLTLFNEHFFYSGVSHAVVLNSAIIALLFASVYNFWEAQRHEDPNRFILAFIFLSQLPANKYQMMLVSVFVLIVGVLIQKNKRLLFKSIFGDKIKVLGLIIPIAILSIWFIKNYLMTGDPFYPIFSGTLHAFGWTPVEQVMFKKVVGGIGVSTFLKYMSVLFIWPGIKAAKLVLFMVYALPLALLFLHDSVFNQDKDKIKEIGYWVGMSMLILLGICLACHQDPRYYRFPLAVYSFAAVYGWYFLMVKLWRFPELLAIALLLVFATANMANEGARIALTQGGDEEYPTIKENVEVLTGHLSTKQAIEQRYPEIEREFQLFKSDPDKFEQAAWDMRSAHGNLPEFFLPRRPLVYLWFTNLVHWDSYGDNKKIIQDFHDQNIDWVMVRENDGNWKFISVEEFAPTLTSQMRFPSKKSFSYTDIPAFNDVGPISNLR